MSTSEYIKETSLVTAKHRMHPYIGSITDHYTMYSMLGMSLEHADDDSDPDRIAYTDGRHVYACPGFDTKLDNAKQRTFAILHEWAHNGLAHPARARQLIAQYGSEFDPFVWNIATDAIINTALSNNPDVDQLWIEAPKICIYLPNVLKELGLWRDGDDEADVVMRWSAEALYFELLKAKNQFLKMLANGQIQIKSTITASGNANGKPNQSSGSGGVPFWLPFARDLVPGETPVDDEGKPISNEDEIRNWTETFVRSCGSMPSMMKRLAGDIPRTRTPWNRELRVFMNRYANGRHRTTNWARGDRRYLALEYPMLTREHVRLPFQPDRSRPGRTGRIAVGVDTSGSIGKKELDLFNAELATMMEQTGARILLIVCDAKVHQVIEFRGYRDSRKLRNFQYKGGGGTDFRPIIRTAEDWGADCLVILTDLFGPAGEKPRFPVKWAIPDYLESQAPVPFGTTIILPTSPAAPRPSAAA